MKPPDRRPDFKTPSGAMLTPWGFIRTIAVTALVLALFLTVRGL